MGDLDLILERLCRVARTGRRVALLFDYDGTLAPVRPTPAEATLPPATRRGLERLAANDRLVLGVLSGRAMADLRGMVRMPGAYLGGTGGLELDLRGRKLSPPGLEAALGPLDQIAAKLQVVAGRHIGAWVEQKPCGLTLHYRGVEPARVTGLRREAADVVRAWPGQFRMEDVTLGLEVVPDLGWDKGTAVREMLAEAGGEPFPVYAGDAANDAPAFRAAESAGGLSIGVGPAAPPAMAHVCRPCVIGSLALLLGSVFRDERCVAGAGG
ncbi:MAG TPA: trehalose-phosphatase [Gemmataceae bacterium]|nr:trehalose-phosphatase [Gemmataceae bacterium]